MTKLFTLPALLALTAAPETQDQAVQVLRDLSAKMNFGPQVTAFVAQIVEKAPTVTIAYECIFDEVAPLPNCWDIIGIMAVAQLEAVGVDMMMVCRTPGHEMAKLLVQYARETHERTLRENLRRLPREPLTPEEETALYADVPLSWLSVDTSAAP